MGFNLMVEGPMLLKYDKDIISGVQAALASPGDSRAKSTKGYMTLIIAGKLHADNGGENSQTVELFKWAQVPAEKEEAYRKVTVVIEGQNNAKFRTITLDKAFVVDYSEMYSSQVGIGSFNMVIRQKADVIDAVTVESDPVSEIGGFGGNGVQSGALNEFGRAVTTAALNKVDPSGTAANALWNSSGKK